MINGIELLRRPGVSIYDVVATPGLRELADKPEYSARLFQLVEEDVKYGAFVEREKREVERRAALEHKQLPADIDYGQIEGLRIEAASKLSTRRPSTIGEAGRLLGVTPSDVAALLIHTAKAEAAAT